jgi:hypothetical protein
MHFNYEYVVIKKYLMPLNIWNESYKKGQKKSQKDFIIRDGGNISRFFIN